ncbi:MULTISPECIES: hypothetical protein [unclassified Pseudoalteromonas]|uniref:hypothetical protein n=1 Tax=unclassified Pseudoalteromonas TaxID=194690 RepID=UPI0002C8D98A|nr:MULTISPECIES: hypothetical protein [unclassified Pseudoalteromonas]ENO00791.1 hypothetical protein J139_00550 [Pseudoalteromonas agarivorans S816]MDI3244604.1 hypothetical protein [Pseudoalteromonas agarivorans]TMS66901.1 hypothetical protein CWB86_16770 [Pseudoalteromonas sp. S1731]TMS84780.1 hypothetical protein CWB70_13720 [Pseudoalteromonas sp. S981]TMS89529.1 hypothetical protein CWB69_09090 [Pseudoalteromonas sp. S980]
MLTQKIKTSTFLNLRASKQDAYKKFNHRVARGPSLSPVGVKLAHAISEAYIFKPTRQQARCLQII